jgi:UBA-like domain
MDENVNVFMSITGCNKAETAKFFLESSDNDVEQAVNMYMESGGDAGGMQPAEAGALGDVAAEQPAGEDPAAVIKPDDPDEQRRVSATHAAYAGILSCSVSVLLSVISNSAVRVASTWGHWWMSPCRWYTGGGAGGSGQEVIAPGTGAEKVKGFMDAIQPHARQGTAEDLKSQQGAFSGSSRTLNGTCALFHGVAILPL